MEDEAIRDLALMMAVNCVRNSCIESYHAEGKLDDRDMKTFNKEVVNRIYTFLNRFFNATGDERKAFLERMHFMSVGSTASWDEPQMDRNLWDADDWND